jgi:hypothetical protein
MQNVGITAHSLAVYSNSNNHNHILFSEQLLIISIMQMSETYNSSFLDFFMSWLTQKTIFA